MSLTTGIIGNNEIHYHDAYNINHISMENMVRQTFDNLKFERSNRVFPLLSVNSSVKIHNCKVAIDPLLLFQRISLNKKFDKHLREYLKYELSLYPLAKIGMRKTKKSLVYKCFKSCNIELDTNNITYIIDDGFLLHHVVWQQNNTFHCIIDRYVDYVQRYFGSNIIVVFDGYNNNSKNIKAMEQLRRTAALSGSFEVIFKETMHVTMSQKNFLANLIAPIKSD